MKQQRHIVIYSKHPKKDKKMLEELLKKFREKLETERYSLTWFHREFIRHIPGKKITYTYFGMMVNQPDRMKPEVEVAIQKFVDKD